MDTSRESSTHAPLVLWTQSLLKRNLRNLCSLRIIKLPGLVCVAISASKQAPRLLFVSIRVHSRLKFWLSARSASICGWISVWFTWPSAATSGRRRLKRGLTDANLVRIARPTSKTGWNDSALWYGRVRAAARRWRYLTPQIINGR